MPHRERGMDHVQFDPSIFRRFHEALQECPPRLLGGFNVHNHIVQQALAFLVVHRPAVVGIDHGEIPKLIALIKIRRPGRGELHQSPREAVPKSRPGDAGRQLLHLAEENAISLMIQVKQAAQERN